MLKNLGNVKESEKEISELPPCCAFQGRSIGPFKSDFQFFLTLILENQTKIRFFIPLPKI